jgi:hypothetical protein
MGSLWWPGRDSSTIAKLDKKMSPNAIWLGGDVSRAAGWSL